MLYLAGDYWIGLTDKDVEGVFVWSNGDPVTYTKWNERSGEPNSPTSPENCVVMSHMSNYFWHDVNCEHVHKPICEYIGNYSAITCVISHTNRHTFVKLHSHY